MRYKLSNDLPPPVRNKRLMRGLRVPAMDMQPRSVPWLPPEETRLWSPDVQGRIETPLDAHGMTDLDALVQLGTTTIAEGYIWASPFNDVHHLQWPAAAYAQNEGPYRDFRELVQRKAFIPRQFHNWLHILTLPPPMPTEEVMRHSIEAERTARALAVTAQLAVRLTRMSGIPEDKLVKRLEEQFENYQLYVENAREVPVEFQLLKLAEVEARSIDEMLLVNKRLGKLALNQIPIRFRKLQPAV